MVVVSACFLLFIAIKLIDFNFILRFFLALLCAGLLCRSGFRRVISYARRTSSCPLIGWDEVGRRGASSGSSPTSLAFADASSPPQITIGLCSAALAASSAGPRSQQKSITSHCRLTCRLTRSSNGHPTASHLRNHSRWSRRFPHLRCLVPLPKVPRHLQRSPGVPGEHRSWCSCES